MKNISVIRTDYTHFKNALNKEVALNEIIEQRCQDAINSAAMAKPVNYKILEKLRDDSTVSEKIKQSADSWIETLNKPFGEEIVNELSGISEEYLQKQLPNKQLFTSKKSTDEHSDKSTESHSFEHDQGLTVKKYIASMLLQFAVLDKNIGTVKVLLDFDADPRVENIQNGESAISFALIKKDFVDTFLTEVTSHTSLTENKLDVTKCLVLSNIRFIDDYENKNDLMQMIGELYDFDCDNA